MTVKELIDLLKEFPEDMEVMDVGFNKIGHDVQETNIGFENFEEDFRADTTTAFIGTPVEKNSSVDADDSKLDLLLSQIGKIPDEWIERNKHIVCELTPLINEDEYI